MKPEFKYLHLDLDALYTDGYFYTEYDIGGAGHSITIKAEDKERFLDAFATEIRYRVSNMLIGKNSEYIS